VGLKFNEFAMVNWLQSILMELLLNIAWLTLALMALSGFVRRRRDCTWIRQVPYPTALLAIGCALVLLFPVVSASDDLHPSQAVLEDANKRIQQFSVSLQHAANGGSVNFLPALLAIYLLASLVELGSFQPDAVVAQVLSREYIPFDGRSPPTL
jgi:hypothetical protein